jgi:phosphatidylserine decarboxylase
MGAIAKTRFPRPLQRAVIQGYAKVAGIDLENGRSDISEFLSLQDFFTRPKKNGFLLPISTARVVSPADGVVISCGRVGGRIFSKGFEGNLEAFFESRDAAEHFEGGTHLSIHLRPQDYHRFHMPVQGMVSVIKHIPGGLLPVNKSGRRLFPSLYWKNERKIALIDSVHLGKVAFAAVGALGVGGITIYQVEREMDRGAELGYFTLGSNIILFFEKGRVELVPTIKADVSLDVGQALSLT